jgi:hypothetical protein
MPLFGTELGKVTSWILIDLVVEEGELGGDVP